MGGGMGGAKFNTVAMRPPSTGDRSLPNNWKAGAKDDCKYTYIILSNKQGFRFFSRLVGQSDLWSKKWWVIF